VCNAETAAAGDTRVFRAIARAGEEIPEVENELRTRRDRQRIVDIGIPHYLVASSLRLAIAQRLVRKLCSSCREAYEPKSKEVFSKYTLSSDVIYKAKGCDHCNFIGYRARSLISEVLLVDEEMRNLIFKKGNEREIIALAKSKGFLSLLESGFKKVESGITSLEEVISVAL